MIVLLDLLLEAVHLSSSAASGCLSNMDFQIAVPNSHCGNQLLQNVVLYLAPCGLSVLVISTGRVCAM